MIEALLFGGPMDGKTMKIPNPAEFINVPHIMLIARDETGRFMPDSKTLVGHYVYDRERTIHDLVPEAGSGPSEPCYKWVEDGN